MSKFRQSIRHTCRWLFCPQSCGRCDLRQRTAAIRRCFCKLRSNGIPVPERRRSRAGQSPIRRTHCVPSRGISLAPQLFRKADISPCDTRRIRRLRERSAPRIRVRILGSYCNPKKKRARPPQPKQKSPL